MVPMWLEVISWIFSIGAAFLSAAFERRLHPLRYFRSRLSAAHVDHGGGVAGNRAVFRSVGDLVVQQVGSSKERQVDGEERRPAREEFLRQYLRWG